MGSLLSGVCFPTVDLARSVFCSGTHISVATSSTVTTEFFCTNPVGPYGVTSFERSAYQNGQYTGVSYGNYPPFPSCTFDGGTGMMSEYFAALLAFVTIVFVASRLKRIFWADHESV
jgi:hypothetical protein